MRKPISETDVRNLVRKNILALTPYSSARDEFTGDAAIFLDANENPFPSPYNRYPDPLQRKLRARIAELKGVEDSQVFVGNGSDEPIDLLIRAFCEPAKDSILVTDPTYGMYAVCAGINNVAVQRTLLTTSFQPDLDAIEKAITANTRIIFLCSPNNPTGNLLDRDTIIHLASGFKGLLVVDEAYIDFAPTASLLWEIGQFPNLVILQTLSKAWGLAGLRIGMCFASPFIISILNKIKYPYNMNVQSQQLALEALANTDRKKEWVKTILSERDRLVHEFRKLPVVQEVFPSDANFLLIKVKNATAAYNDLTNRGIIVRDRSKVARCENCLRVTVGTPEENTKLIDALKTL